MLDHRVATRNEDASGSSTSGLPVPGAWAKFERGAEGELAWHSLLDHSADVAACCSALLGRTLIARRLARLGKLEELDEIQRDRLCLLAGIHDLGKANLGFQNKILDRPGFVCGHVAEARALVEAIGRDPALVSRSLFEFLETITSWFENDGGLEMLLATISHHGRAARKKDFAPTLWEPSKDRDPLADLDELFGAARLWFPRAWDPGGIPLPAAPEFQHAWSGLVTLADWIGSDSERFFPLACGKEPERFERSRAMALSAIKKIGLDVGAAREDREPSLNPIAAVLNDRQPRAQQTELSTLGLPEESGLFILEAPTGSGKTEAALVHFLRLFFAGSVDGMYFALPTRTAATQIYQRVHRAVERIFPVPSVRPPVVQAVPGYIAADGYTAASLPNFEVLWNDDDPNWAQGRGWAAERPKRFLAGAIVVGTIDQVLLSTLNISHAELRSTALSRQLLVVDEVHASDVYMSRLLEEVLTSHLASGGHALLMSATLGSSARSRFMGIGAPDSRRESLRLLLEEKKVSYPAIHATSERGRSSLTSVPWSGPTKEVGMELLPAMEDAAPVAVRALSAATSGGRVLVIRNTVAGCRATQAALESLAITADAEETLFRCNNVVAPHHGRFAKSDREALDRALVQVLGPQEQDSGVVVAATQTCEQSLDIDADLLITDLCPIDVLLQRIGRLHRWSARKRRPSFVQPRVVVLLPLKSLVEYVNATGVARAPGGLGTVYEDLRILELTHRLLVSRKQLRLPSENRSLVEEATHPEGLRSLHSLPLEGDRWRAHGTKVEGMWYARRRHASAVLLPRDKGFSDDIFAKAGNAEEIIGTRLGLADRLVRFGSAAPGPFGKDVMGLSMSTRTLNSPPARA